MVYKNNSIKAVVFDMDGTIMDTDRALVPMFKRLLKTVDVEVSKQEILKYSGMDFKSWARKLLPNPKKETVGKLRGKWHEIFPDEFFQYISKMEGAEEILEFLKNDYKLVLLTNTPKNMALSILERFKLKEYFDLILGRKEDFKKPKPYPEALLVALNKLKLNKDQVIFVGDTKYDQMAGKRAGIETLILKKDIDSLKELKDYF